MRNESGQLKTVYHGTGADFNTFSYDYMSQHGSMEGQGFYFTDSRSMAEGYQRDGGRVMEGYLDIRKPLQDNEVILTKAQTCEKAGRGRLPPAGCFAGDQTSAMSSTSQRTFFGRDLTATQLRAGLPVKYLP